MVVESAPVVTLTVRARPPPAGKLPATPLNELPLMVKLPGHTAPPLPAQVTEVMTPPPTGHRNWPDTVAPTAAPGLAPADAWL